MSETVASSAPAEGDDTNGEPPDIAAADPMRRLLAIMARLRGPGGCPWDRAQTFATIAPYTIEEAYEVADAIARDDVQELKSELGDLLLQVVFHARMAEEAGAFAFNDVAAAISAKMLDRHPHVFGHAGVEEAAAQEKAWEALKARERAEKAAAAGRTPSALDDVALALPALMRAQKIAKRAARAGFDYADAHDARAKLHEEIDELFEALSRDEAGEDGARDDVVEELGDVLFSAVCVAMKLKVDAEEALRAGNAKFEARFRAMEAHLAQAGRTLQDCDMTELDAAWDAVKAAERGAKV